MNVTKAVCQVRRDIKSSGIPVSLLLRGDVKQRIEELLHARPEEGDSDVPDELLEALAKERPETAAAMRRRVRERIEVKNGYVEVAGGTTGERVSIAVENLSIAERSLYIRALAATPQCATVLQAVQDILVAAGLPAAILADSTDDCATETSVVLDGPIESLLAPAFPSRVFPAIVNAAQDTPQTKVVIHPYSIQMKVHRWNPEAIDLEQIQPDTWDFTIAHEKYADHDKRVYKVYTRFAYDKHMTVVATINTVFAGGKK